MRPGGGKYKGSGFEREIGAALSTWLSNGERDDLVTRTVISGGQFTQSAKSGKLRGVPGDLMSSHPVANQFFEQFVMECKFWKYLPLFELLFPRPGNKTENELMYAISKVKGEAEQTKKPYWMLVARQNYQRTIAFMPPSIEHANLLISASVIPHYFFDNLLMSFDFYLFLAKISACRWLNPTNFDNLSDP